ncbi:MAG: GerMN domain-containing protein [Oscillospiraceae bacterium]|jgi:germination protein M|nr:GerMN domain-containing protein [Oscillospiraceae bacterium]
MRRFLKAPSARRAVALTAALVLICLSACSTIPRADSEQEYIEVYRRIVSSVSPGSQLLRAEKIPYTEGDDIVMGAALALRSAPEDPSLVSALPPDVNITRATLAGHTVDVLMSAPYAKLEGMEKSLLEGAVALTMCSLPGVDFVRLHTEDNSVTVRLSSEEILLYNTVVSGAQAQVRLYFPRLDQAVMSAEYADINPGDDASPERLIMDLLLAGPSSEKLYSAIPEDTVVLSVYTQDGVCRVNFSSEFLEIAQEDTAVINLTIYSVVNSLTNLPEVDSVQIFAQNMGSAVLGTTDVSRPLTRRASLIGAAIY